MTVAYLLAAAKAAGVPASLFLAVCAAESGLKHVVRWSDGTSPSYGACQVKYETALMVDPAARPSDMLIPAKSATFAALYLKRQLDRYDGDYMKAISAYNAGTYTTRNVRYVNRVVLNKLKGERDGF